MATPTLSASETPTATPTATKSPAASLSFSLDAARVSKPNDPGDLQGLAAIKPGSTVWLMLYYTLQSLPKTMKRTSTYEVLYAGKTVYKVTYAGSASPSPEELGRHSRYTKFVASAHLPYGKYVFRATLEFGKHAKSKSWHFSVGPQERLAQTAHTH